MTTPPSKTPTPLYKQIHCRIDDPRTPHFPQIVYCVPWDDVERLRTVGREFADLAVARSQQLEQALRDLAAAGAELAEAKAERDALKHDIERHLQIASDLATDLARARRDGERYRFLREHVTFQECETLSPLKYYYRRWYHDTVFKLEADTCAGMFDAAIDAALAERKDGDE